MSGVIGWLKKRKERKKQEEERLDKNLRASFAGFPEITTGRMDLSKIGVGEITDKSIRGSLSICPVCGAFKGKGKDCVMCGGKDV